VYRATDRSESSIKFARKVRRMERPLALAAELREDYGQLGSNPPGRETPKPLSTTGVGSSPEFSVSLEKPFNGSR
jgi:hypothetical protein